MNENEDEQLLLGWLLLFAFSAAVYWVFRYSLLLAEGDGTRLTNAALGIVEEGRLVTSQWRYANGYGYQSLLASLSLITDVPVQSIQRLGGLWLPVVALAAYLAYRTFLQSASLAVAAVFLLLVQPDFIFYIFRSSHEKTTWLYALLIFWLWSRTPDFGRISTKTAAVLSIYLLFWAMIANNAYLGSTILTTFALAAVLASLLALLPRPWLPPQFDASTVQRLRYLPLIGTVLLFIFITYTYEPVRSYYGTLGSLAKRLMAVFFGREQIDTAASYIGVFISRGGKYIQQPWKSTSVYLLLTGVQWGIAIGSISAWVRDLIFLRRLTAGRWTLWLFYAGFVFQLGLGVLVDFSGSLAANLQLRLFTPFAMLSSPLAATWLLYLPKRIPSRTLRLAACVVGMLAITVALFKASNEPLVGNLWLYTTPREQASFNWLEENLANELIWIDIWVHMEEAMEYQRGYQWQPKNFYVAENLDAPYIMYSKLTESQAYRSTLSLPSLVGRNTIYTNGSVQVLHQPQP